MGGMGSGRWGGRPTVGSGLSLDLNKLLRNGTLSRNATTTGTISWSYTHSDEQFASMGYKATLGPERGHIQFHWTTTNRSGEKQHSEQWIELEAKAQPLGGRRWWFVCPRRGDRVWKLYMPPGTSTFASRRAYRLAYRSQRQSPHDRALSQAFRLRRRLGAEGGIGDPVPKPKGMRWATYDRHIARIDAAEEVCNLHLLATMRRFGMPFELP